MEEHFEYDGTDKVKSGKIRLLLLENDQSDRIKCYTFAIRYNL